jgi:hypothetical protein
MAWGWSLARTCRGVADIGLEYFEPIGRLGGSLDDPKSCGGVEQAGLQNLDAGASGLMHHCASFSGQWCRS